jgi:hypothetical protein
MNGAYTPDVLTRAVRDHLAGLKVAGMKPAASVAKDPWHVIEILMTSPRGLRLVTHWAGEEPLGDEPEAPLSTQRVEVIVGYALGLKSSADAALVENTDERPSLLRIVAEVRGRVLSMAFGAGDASEGLFRYRGAEPVETPEGVPLAAYRLKFELDTTMPEIRPVEV